MVEAVLICDDANMGQSAEEYQRAKLVLFLGRGWGETREERLLEFIEVNPGVTVVGLREGSILKIEDSEITLLGKKSARVFLKGREPQEYTPQRRSKPSTRSASMCW